MDTIKLLPPEGVTSASVDGVQFDADAEGVFTVPAGAAIQLYGFGFTNAPAKQAAAAPAEGSAATTAAAAPTGRKGKPAAAAAETEQAAAAPAEGSAEA